MKKLFTILFAISLIMRNLVAQGAKESDLSSRGKVKAPIEISFWHIFGDARGQWIQDRVDNFNDSQSKYHVMQENKGSYRDTIQVSLLAYRQGSAPTLVHVAEAGSQQAYDSGIFIPIS
ncbi:MAG: hypothetical protein JJE21_04320 [Spirochaetaceae bacterium]|nr:hypothetical protein [Spirochaetaceae bacterium]